MDFADDYARSAPWEKVTRKVIDPITFACTASIEYRPQLEECSFETTGPSISEPRFGDGFKRSTRKGVAAPAWSPPTSRTPQTTSRKVPTAQPATKKVSGSNSLGAFFQKSSAAKKQDPDNMSVGSRSIASRSIADLSIAERSKTEDKLKRKAKSKHQKRKAKTEERERNKEMQNIAEDKEAAAAVIKEPAQAPPATPNFKPKSCLVKKLKYAIDDDNNDDDDKSISLEDVEKSEKKLRWGDDREEFEIDRITGSMYDDLFYGSEELADFRYEAFLEDAGLDADEYM